MKKIIKITAFLFIILSLSMDKNNNFVEFQLTEEIKIIEIEHDVFLVIHSFPWPGNSLLVKLDNKNMVWIDTPYTPEATASVIHWIYTKFGKNFLITEINTGFHIDNLGGNQELINNNIPIYGSNLTCELLRTKSKATMSTLIKWLNIPTYQKYQDVYSNFDFIEPTHKFDINEEQKITLGSEELIIFYPGPTHTYDNIVVYLPGKKILFGGCMILSAEANKPGYIDDGNLQEWVRSLSTLEKRFDKCRIIVPGHGNPGDYQLINHTKNIINISINKKSNGF